MEIEDLLADEYKADLDKLAKKRKRLDKIKQGLSTLLIGAAGFFGYYYREEISSSLFRDEISTEGFHMIDLAEYGIESSLKFEGVHASQEIPLLLGHEVNTVDNGRSDYHEIKIDPGVSYPKTIYMVVYSQNASEEYRGREIGRLDAVYENKEPGYMPFVLGENIFDSSWEDEKGLEKLNGLNEILIEVDMVYAWEELDYIRIVDTSVSSLGEKEPSIHVLAITIEER